MEHDQYLCYLASLFGNLSWCSCYWRDMGSLLFSLTYGLIDTIHNSDLICSGTRYFLTLWLLLDRSKCFRTNLAFTLAGRFNIARLFVALGNNYDERTELYRCEI